MMEHPDQPPVMVDQMKDLLKLAQILAKQPQVAIDTESNSLFAYQEQVCLIQISIPNNDYMVDPIAIPDLSPLAPIFANPAIEKIFHAAEYDLICLKRDYGYTINHVFDTMQAARILGRVNVGLGSMLEAEFGLVIEKKYQRANWGERPIPPAMLAYAREDSHYLIDLRNRLQAELIEKNLDKLAEEDFHRVTLVDAGATELEPPAWWRLGGSQALTVQQAGVLQALLDYRDQQARRADLPHFKILSNDTLVKIAEELPSTWEALADVPGLSSRQRDRHAAGLLGAVRYGLVTPPPARPVNHRRSDAVLERLEHLRDWRKETARLLGVESDVVLPRDVMEAIADHGPRSLQDLRREMKDIPWRYDQYASRIMSALQKKE